MKMKTLSLAMTLALAGALASFAQAPAASTTPAAKATTAPKAAKAPAAAADPAPTDAQIADAKAKGLVWVNLNTKVYHTEGQFYGKTAKGKFMTKDDAEKAGFKAAKEPKPAAPKAPKAPKATKTDTGKM